MSVNELRLFRAQVRQAVADYMRSEGCDCCRNVDAHKETAARLAKLLRVKRYSDGDGFDFQHFRSKPATRCTCDRVDDMHRAGCPAGDGK